MVDPFPHPLSLDLHNNPFPCYQWLRAERRVYYSPEENYWALSRYADVIAAARNHADLSSAEGIGRGSAGGQTMLSTDPPQHTRLRSLVSRAFHQGVIENMAPRIEAICDELIDASAVARGSFDLMVDFANPLPLRVITHMLGFDPRRHADYTRWMDATVELLNSPDSGDVQRRYAGTAREFQLYLYQLGRARLRTPGDDLFSLLLQACIERDMLTPLEIAYTCELLLAAGGETTAGLIGNAALALAAHPDQAAEVIAEPSLIPSLIEEVVRYDGPFRATFRTATRDLEIHGVVIPKGGKVALLLAAANRDPAAFAAPDRFVVRRSPNQHLGFGSGVHYCLGAPLARLETRVAAGVLLRRFRRLQPKSSGPHEWSLLNPMLRKLSRLPMDFELY